MDLLTPEYLAGILEAPLPSVTTVTTLSEKKKTKKVALIVVTLAVGAAFAGVVYAAYSHHQKQERERRLALAVANARRKRTRTTDAIGNSLGNGRVVDYWYNEGPMRRVSGDDDAANINSYDDKYAETTYAVL